MNSQLQTASNAPLLSSLLALICLALYPSWSMADEPSSNPTTMSFGADGLIRMKLNKGTMEVVGVSDERITVSWHSRFLQDERDVSVQLYRSGEKDATVVIDGPGDRMRYRIEVPRQSDTIIHMQAGNLEVHDLLGSVDADLLAGNMDLRVAEPRHYRTVSASVFAGGLSATPWHTDTGGLWRSFKASGNGGYDLRAHLLAGQLTIRPE